MSRNVVYADSAVHPIPFNPDAMYTEQMGMDIRTYIAIQVLSGMMPDVISFGFTEENSIRASRAVAQADALIAELNK